VLRLIELERGDAWVLRGKTGLGRHGGRPVGTLVGSVTAQGHTWIQALVLRGSTFDALMPMWRELAAELLRRHGVLPAR
jgi:beta-lactamase class D